MNIMKKVLLTGATGVMGYASLPLLTSHSGELSVRVLARHSAKNEKKLTPFRKRGMEVAWGDLTSYEDVRRALEGVDILLHLGGMVSPLADRYPDKTVEVNVGSMENIISAINELKQTESTEVVYIGSVAQYGFHNLDNPWGETGEPLIPAFYDAYAYSKIEAERLLTESGIHRWVSLRQSGILHPGLLTKTDDPIMFHVPLRGVLEWATVEDSARLLESLCVTRLPEEFWRKFYNISSGPSYRLSNYEFEKIILKSTGCPPPEKIFEPHWFATRNFHGMWYVDSDRLEEYLHFRANVPVDEYFRNMTKGLPWYFKLSPLAPAWIIKLAMKRVAKKKGLGTLWWFETGDEGRIEAHFGSRKEWKEISGWGHQPEMTADESIRNNIPRNAVRKPGEAFPASPESDIPEELTCGKGHHYRLTPRARLLGGHVCPECGRLRAKGIQ